MRGSVRAVMAGLWSFGYRIAPDADATETKLVNAAICTMLGKPIAATG